MQDGDFSFGIGVWMRHSHGQMRIKARQSGRQSEKWRARVRQTVLKEEYVRVCVCVEEVKCEKKEQWEFNVFALKCN